MKKQGQCRRDTSVSKEKVCRVRSHHIDLALFIADRVLSNIPPISARGVMRKKSNALVSSPASSARRPECTTVYLGNCDLLEENIETPTWNTI